MKIFFYIVIGLFSCPVMADKTEFNVEREWLENFSVDSSALTGNKLVVDVTSGAINVTGHPGSEISAQVNIHWWGKRESDLVQAAKELQLVVEQTANGYLIFLETPFRDRSYDYFTRSRDYEFRYDITLQVPRNLDLELHTVMDGDVRLNGISSNVEIENVTGNVLLDNVLAA